ncbi:MAG: ester cyclase [Candidatus Promineifilaceae bacterium]|nr:ester cyclase [Candidatus Promineifilaceae bacterium]
MTTKANKAIARRIFTEILSEGNLDPVDELIAPNQVSHGMPPEMPDGIEGVKLFVHYFRKAFPDGKHTIHNQIAEGDQVVSRVTAVGTHSAEFLGIPATGRSVVMDGIVINRFSGGKVVETWALYDDLSVFRQLGGIPN